MTTIFKTKIQEGYVIKILVELLNNTVRNICLGIFEHGIEMRTMDSQRHILINVEIQKTKLNIYELDHTIYTGINLSHLYKMLKTLKKKDSIVLYIFENDPNKLFIDIISKEGFKISTAHIQLQQIQNLDIELPTGYDNTVIVPSNQYQRTLKDINNLNEKISIVMRKYSLDIACSDDNIFSRTIYFGEPNDASDVRFQYNYNIDMFIRTIKLAGLNNVIYISGLKEFPIRLKTDIGSIGSMSLYIKSNEQIEKGG